MSSQQRVDYSATTNDLVIAISEHGRMVVSDYVIVAMLLPILKEGDIEVIPPLPMSMTFGHPGLILGGFKIFFEFTNDFMSYAFCFPDLDGSHGKCLNLDGESLYWYISSINGRSDNGNATIEGYSLGSPLSNSLVFQILQWRSLFWN